MARQTTGAFTCPDCGRSFSLERGLTRHRNYAHPGAQTVTQPEPTQPAAPEEEPVIWFDDLRRLAQPLQQEVNAIQAELDQLNIRRDQLLGRLRPIKGALDRLKGPNAKPGPKANGVEATAKTKGRKQPKAQRASEQAMAEVLDYIQAHQEELADGFIGAQLQEKMNANGSHAVSKDRMRLVLAQLHERGILRLVRKTQGGGKLYKLTAAGGGEG